MKGPLSDLSCMSTNLSRHVQYIWSQMLSGQMSHEETNVHYHVAQHYFSQGLSLCEIIGGVVWSNHSGGCDMLRVVVFVFQVIIMPVGCLRSNNVFMVSILFSN